MRRYLFISACVLVGPLAALAADDKPPFPRVKPLVPMNSQAPSAPDVPDVPVVVVTPPKPGANCATLLADLEMDWKAIPTIGTPGSCGTEFPVIVSAIQGVKIKPEATFNCAMAASVYKWVAADIIPAAQRELGKKLVSIQNASSYVCRRRNNQATGKMSEHAIANAFDIASFTFADGSEATVTGSWSGFLPNFGLSKPNEFLRANRKSACAIFTTVLGPGSDQAHGDHFHVDLAFRKSGYRICN